ncbi:MAG: iron-containing alcohol dehydrogenase family protein [Streptosporangiales bacterium]|nr:iron-containing alcohol dehydrogenase family protein [Streptosporangiales bacterium]
MVMSPLAVEVRRGAVAGLSGLLADQRISSNGVVAAVVGGGIGDRIAGELSSRMANADVFTAADGRLDVAADLEVELRKRSYDAVVGIGGGKTLDVAKYVASRLGLPMVAVATSLAHDGISSPVATLDHDGGRGSYGVHIPVAVVVDLDYVHAAPARQVRSGVGDLVSNLSATADWELARAERGEPVDGLALSLARVGAEAVLGRTDGIDSDPFLTLLAEGLVLSGLAMAVAGTSLPCSGACHEISHALDRLGVGDATHGEQVGLGALFATWLRGDLRLAAAMRDCLGRHGLPTTPADLALEDRQFACAVAAAPDTRPDRYTILEHVGLDDAAAQRRTAEFVGWVTQR